MQNAERERLIGQMSAAPERRVAVLAKVVVCVGVLGVLLAVGMQTPEYVPDRVGASAGRAVPAMQADVRAEAHRKQVFDARRQHAADLDFALTGQDMERQGRMAYVAP